MWNAMAKPAGVAAFAALCLLAGSPVDGAIVEAGDLLVDLDAAADSAGDYEWENAGLLGSFSKVGDPVLEVIDGVSAVRFRGLSLGAEPDAYRCVENAPAGIVGLDATRSIEVWAYNDDIADEETLVAWGRRGGPDGTNMSFNYGRYAIWGAVGHWGWPDIGWNDGGGAPPAGVWHHLAYTFDGTTTRVYADGVLMNTEVLGAGVINTHPGFPIVIGAQTLDTGVGLDAGQAGTLAIARVRVHDDVLSDDDVLNNYTAEKDTYQVEKPPVFVEAPSQGAFVVGDPVYSAVVVLSGYPVSSPHALQVLEPVGATVTDLTGLSVAATFSYTIPDPPPSSFAVVLQATNGAGSAQASWTVTRRVLPADDIAVAEELLVSLDAADGSAGEDEWTNDGSLANFVKIGVPYVTEIEGVPAVVFNEMGPTDAYECLENAPAGIVGPSPTRSIEVWAFNEMISDEETLVAWGRRGGGDGTNMSFNYGFNGSFGAVGHWGAGPDLGWNDAGGAPAPAQWHHLVYTFDGATTRVYADGELSNSETLLPGAINTHAGTPITLAAQRLNTGAIDWNLNLVGSLALARVRVHDGVLSPSEILHNYNLERAQFGIADEAPEFVNPPDRDFFYAWDTVYARRVTATGIPYPTFAVLEPEGATIDRAGDFLYTLPDPAPAQFTVTLSASNGAGSVQASWVVTRVAPVAPAQDPVHRYSFSGNADDAIGGAHGTVYGNVVFGEGQAFLSNDGSQFSNMADPFPDPFDPEKTPPGAYIELPNGIISALGARATFEAWVTCNGPTSSVWQRIFDFGISDGGENASSGAPNSYYIFLTPRSGANTLRFGYNSPVPVRIERMLDGIAIDTSEETHVAVVWNDDTTTAELYVNGVRVGMDVLKHFSLADIPDVNNWLGRAQWPDAMFNGSYNEFRIYDYALNPAEVMGSYECGPDCGGQVIDTVAVRTGDVNGDGALNIADAIAVLQFLFGEPKPAIPCMKAADANDDDALNIADAITVLSYLFAGQEMKNPDGTILAAGAASNCVAYDKVHIPETLAGQPGCATPCVP